MRVLAFLGAAGFVLIAMLFVADATLEKGSPAIVTTQRSGLPKPTRHPDEVHVLTSTPAPAPDMTSQAVLAAQPKSAPDALPRIEPAAHATWAEAPPENRRPVRDHFQLSNSVDRFSIKGQ
jgi:hypothetical protein